MELSFSLETFIEIGNLAEGKDFNIIITLFIFDNLCEDYFKKYIYLVERALFDGNINKEEINNIILSNGPNDS